MRTLSELMTAKEDLPIIYCDMDQVLCNFMAGADKVAGGSFVTADKSERWQKISDTKDFWASLEWMPASKKLWQFIARYDTHILSAYSKRDSNSKPGKMKWLAKNTNIKRGNIHLVQRDQKQAYATKDGKPSVLVDDYIKNIKEWEQRGGIGVHHTSVNKTINRLKSLGYR